MPSVHDAAVITVFRLTVWITMFLPSSYYEFLLRCTDNDRIGNKNVNMLFAKLLLQCLKWEIPPTTPTMFAQFGVIRYKLW